MFKNLVVDLKRKDNFSLNLYTIKKLKLLFSFQFITILIAAQEIKQADALVTPKVAERTITVGGADADISGFDNQSVQFAIDAVAKTGGTVKLNPGLFTIMSPVRMKSNVNLIGSGEETILKRAEGVQTNFTIDADYGELKLTVADADGFEVGMKVQVY